jgi:hypothetical protein
MGETGDRNPPFVPLRRGTPILEKGSSLRRGVRGEVGTRQLNASYYY